MTKKVRLFGANGERTVNITPKPFPTRHIKIGAPAETPPLVITPDLPKPDPVLPAYQQAWTENRQRLIDFLADGFKGSLPDGSVMHEIGDAITAEYAPRKAMTADQWRALTADLLLPGWTDGHWIYDLQQHIWTKYEGLRIARENPYRRTLKITDARILTVMQAITDTYKDEWILLDMILKVATRAFSIAANHKSLLACLRGLYRQGRVAYKRDAYKQHLFRYVVKGTDLQKLVAEVDANLDPANAYPDFTPTGEPITDREPVAVYVSDPPKPRIYEGPVTRNFDVYCQDYADQNDLCIHVESDNGRRTQSFICESERRRIGEQNVRAERERRRR